MYGVPTISHLSTYARGYSVAMSLLFCIAGTRVNHCYRIGYIVQPFEIELNLVVSYWTLDI
jgi:hypothetical protein